MKKTESILIAVALLCVAVLLTSHWAGTLIAPASITLLALFYFMSGFFLFCGLSFSAVFRNFSYTRHTTQDLLFAAAGGIALALLLVGIQSKLMLWSFANSFLLLSLTVAGALCIAALTVYKLLSRSLLSKILLRVGVYGTIGIVLQAVSGETLINHYYRDNNEVAQIRCLIWIDPYNDMLVKKLEKTISYNEQQNQYSKSRNSFSVTP